MSSKAALLVLALVIVIAVVVYVAGSRGGGEAEQPDGSKQTSPGARPAREAGAAGVEARPIPEAAITVDGKADDWASVPVRLRPKHGRWDRTTYKCQAVKLARDEGNLYVLFELSLGIGERFEAQRKATGKASSGALGYLKLRADGRRYNMWIPTGFALRYNADGTVGEAVPLASLEVGLYNADTEKYDDVFEAESTKDPEFIRFGGKVLECKLPLDKLGLAGGEAVTATLDEM